MILSIALFVNSTLSDFAFNSDSIPFWKRTIYRELCLFASKSVLSQLEKDDEVTIINRNFQVYAVRLNCRECVITSDFVENSQTLRAVAKEALLDSNKLIKLLNGTQIGQLQTALFEVKEILVKNFDQLNLRNESLEDLINRSEDMSLQTKLFAKQSAKMNQCCHII